MTKAKKIAILTTVFWSYDGISRAVELQVKALADEGHGHDVTIFTLAANMNAPVGASLVIMGMPANSLMQRIYRLFFPLDLIKAVKYVPKLKGFDIIYSHQYPLNWLAYLAKRKYGIRYIYYNHGISYGDRFSSLAEKTYMKAITAAANWTIKRADDGISISKYMQGELKKQTGLDSEVVYHKIDANRFHKGLDGLAIRQKYNLGDAPILLFVGRVSPHKGVHLLIEAFNLVKQEMPTARLLIVGKHTFGSYSKKLKAISDSSAIFTGDVADEELPLYYAACDVYTTATLWEGFDLPVAEAQACGKPVVAFDIGPHKEIIDTQGILVASGDIKAMAKGIIEKLKKSAPADICGVSE